MIEKNGCADYADMVVDRKHWKGLVLNAKAHIGLK